MAACHSQYPDHSLLLGRLPQATTSWSMPHGRMPLATTSQSMPHGRMPLAIASQSMPHGRLPLPVSKNRDEHAIMPLGCLPLSYFPKLLTPRVKISAGFAQPDASCLARRPLFQKKYSGVPI